jgi:hypothetical protein
MGGLRFWEHWALGSGLWDRGEFRTESSTDVTKILEKIQVLERNFYWPQNIKREMVKKSARCGNMQL